VASVRVRLFASAREAAGCSEARFEAVTLGELLAAIERSYGASFAAVLGTARVWVNGDEPPAGDESVLVDGDEIAVLPPVSGG
jgi:molybdopterin synthase sulfur carrier subunit